MTLMNVMESYWDMLPPEIHETIMMYKRNQEYFDKKKKKRMRELGREIVLYKELKEKWALGHIKCVVKKRLFFPLTLKLWVVILILKTM